MAKSPCRLRHRRRRRLWCWNWICQRLGRKRWNRDQNLCTHPPTHIHKRVPSRRRRNPLRIPIYIPFSVLPCLSRRFSKICLQRARALEYSFEMRKVFCGHCSYMQVRRVIYVYMVWYGMVCHGRGRELKPYKLAVRLSVINCAINFKVLVWRLLVYRGPSSL